MRDIKFRAWREKQKFMLHPHSLIELFTYGELVNPDDVVWMQYTGLKDKNGVEIYDGDVIHNSNFTDDCNHMVDIIEDIGQWFMVDTKEGYAEPLCDWLNSSVVIGNIHQNPELLGN
jgi:uncharacterized phage protein (TIGR01671 family)